MEEAKLYILKILRNGMALMSSPMVEEALTLAREYGITAEELIKKAQEQAYNV
jgi:3-hydroxyisobutyrate dehydrogenase-like beta-hydroxyacid dehydrogenase